jgi:hypothetical protein
MGALGYYGAAWLAAVLAVHPGGAQSAGGQRLGLEPTLLETTTTNDPARGLADSALEGGGQAGTCGRSCLGVQHRLHEVAPSAYPTGDVTTEPAVEANEAHGE